MPRFAFTWADARAVMEVPDAGFALQAGRLLALAAEPTAEAAELTLAVEDAGYSVTWLGRRRDFTEEVDARMHFVTLVSSALLARTGRLILHAGGFVGARGAVLFSGPGRVGKSSLALAAWRRGLSVLGDDWLAIDPAAMRVSAFAKSIKPRMRLAEAPPEIAERCAADDLLAGRLEGEPRLIVGRGCPGMAALDAVHPVAALVFLERDGGATQMRPLAGREALSAMLGQLIVTGAGTGLAILGPLKALLGAGAIHRLNVAEGDVERALDQLIAASS